MLGTRKGFTLIELVIVIAIVGIMSIAVGVSVISSLSAIRLEAARWKLKNDIRYAQISAAALQVAHGVVFDPASETYYIYRQNTSAIVTDPLTQKPFTVDYSTNPDYQGVNLISTTFTNPAANQVEFDSLGAPSQGGIVTLGYGSSTTAISVTQNTGMVD